MPRGRPPGSKNAITLEKVNILQEEKSVVEEVKVAIPKKELKVNCKCDLCDRPIYSSPYKIRLQDLTSKATWHRECSIEKASLCENCAKELNDLIDKFVLKKKPSLKKYR